MIGKVLQRRGETLVAESVAAIDNADADARARLARHTRPTIADKNLRTPRPRCCRARAPFRGGSLRHSAQSVQYVARTGRFLLFELARTDETIKSSTM
jgi:hypothetical protein